MKRELMFFFRSIVYGAGLLFIYDFFRSIRRVWKHGKILTALEDIFFWSAAGIFLFTCLYAFNGGVPRWYFFAGICGGMVAYYWSVSPYVVKFEAFLLKRLKMLISWGKIFMKKVISFVFKTLGMYHGEKCKEKKEKKSQKRRNASE